MLFIILFHQLDSGGRVRVYTRCKVFCHLIDAVYFQRNNKWLKQVTCGDKFRWGSLLLCLRTRNTLPRIPSTPMGFFSAHVWLNKQKGGGGRGVPLQKKISPQRKTICEFITRAKIKNPRTTADGGKY
jgi:hypothetical protein